MNNIFSREIGDTKTVEYLVDSGANINSRDDENRTPLHVAVSNFSLISRKKITIMSDVNYARYYNLK